MRPLPLLPLLALAGCPTLTRDALDLTPGAPQYSGCVPETQRCSPTTHAPEVCSSSARWWPVLPRAANGDPRTCEGRCTLNDAGVAHCAPALADGGVQ